MMRMTSIRMEIVIRTKILIMNMNMMMIKLPIRVIWKTDRAKEKIKMKGT